MSLSSTVLCVGLVLMSLLLLSHGGHENGDTGLVRVERRPVMGTAQIYWPHEHWWGKKKHKKPPPKKKPPKKIIRKNIHKGVKWNNAPDHPVSVECNAHNGEALFRVRSMYVGWSRDRRWKWECQKVADRKMTGCSWTPHINNWRGPINRKCPKNFVLAGIKSEHWNKKEDRRWRLKCCHAPGYETTECKKTGKLNKYQGWMDHRTGRGRVFVGLHSLRQLHGFDREWQMFECKYKRKPKPKVWRPPKDHPQYIPGYKHKFDQPLHSVCDANKGEGVIKVKSKYDSYYKDRVWDWGCGQVTKTPLTDCSWTPDINNWMQDLTFMCPRNKLIAGVKSYHKNQHEDRRWRIRCCGVKGHHTEDCHMTDHVNMLHGDLDHQVGSQCGGTGIMVGLDSHWKQYDRRWRLMECGLTRDEGLVR